MDTYRKGRVGWMEKVALTYIHYHLYNRQWVRVRSLSITGSQPRTMWWPGGGMVGGRRLMKEVIWIQLWWFVLLFCREQHNIVKQLCPPIKKKKKRPSWETSKQKGLGEEGGDGEKKSRYRENVSQHNVFMTIPQLTSCSRKKLKAFPLKSGTGQGC